MFCIAHVGQFRCSFQKNTDFFVLLCLLASFLTFGKVNTAPVRLTFFWGGGSLPTPSFLSAPGPPPPQTDIFLGGGGGEGFKSQPSKNRAICRSCMWIALRNVIANDKHFGNHLDCIAVDMTLAISSQADAP